MNDEKLLYLQRFLAYKFGFKVDVYYQEGKGILAVKHGTPLIPSNVIFQMDEWTFNNLTIE